MLDLDRAVFLERSARIHLIDYAVASRRRPSSMAPREFTTRLHAAPREVAARHLGILGGDPTGSSVADRRCPHLGKARRRQPALADARSIDVATFGFGAAHHRHRRADCDGIDYPEI